MIKYYGKDLLMSGFLRRFSGGAVYDDVEALCLRFYHLHGASHEYVRSYKRNEHVRCYKYMHSSGRPRRDWEILWRPDSVAYLCLSTLWDGEHGTSYGYYPSYVRNVQLYSLLPVYRITSRKKSM